MTDIIATLAQELADVQTLLDHERVEHAATAEDRDHAYARLAEAWELTSTGPSGAQTQSLAETMQADQNALWHAIGSDTGQTHELADAVAEAVERLPQAADALRDYLVYAGYPAAPTSYASLPPALAALCEALL